MTPHVLITGGAGFIGSHLVDILLEAGCRVTVLDKLSPQVHADAPCDADGWPLYLDRRARRIRGDVLTEGVMAGALEGATHLVHLAASVGVGQSMSDIVAYTRNNTLGAAVVLEALSRGRHQVRRVVVASSMSIYGEGRYVTPDGRLVAPPPRSRAQLEAREWDLSLDGVRLEPAPTHEDKPLAPASIYAINKRDHEEMFLTVGRALDIPTVALRLFNAYGPRQALSNPYTGVAAIFISRLLNDRPPHVFEDGRQRRDFVHVRRVADAFRDALLDDSPVWDVFNVGSGQSIDILQIAEVLAKRLDRDIRPEILNRFRVGDIRHCYADTRRFEARFGARPPQSFADGVDDLIEWVASTERPTDRFESSLREMADCRLVV